MSGTLSIGGKQIFSHSDVTDKVTYGSGVPAGTVIDFKSSIMSNEISGITQDTWLATGLSIDITPKYINSKMVIWCSVGSSLNNILHNALKVVRTGPSTSDLHIHSSFISTGYVSGLGSYTATDSPNTDTVQCTYELYHYVDTNSAQYFFNYDNVFSSNASMILMEIKQ